MKKSPSSKIMDAVASSINGSSVHPHLDAWGAPYDMISVSVPQPLPPDCFPPVIREWALVNSKSFGNDPSLALLAGLLVAGVAIHDDIHIIAQDGWEESPILWLVGIGGPSTAKTPVEEEAAKALDPLHDKLVNDTRLEWEEENKGKKPSERTSSRAPLTGFRTTVGGVEALSEIRANNEHGLLLFHPEFVSIASRLTVSHDTQSEERRGDYLAAFDGQRRTIHRKIAGQTEVPNWGFSIMSAATYDILPKLTEAADGLFQRFCALCVPPQVKSDMQSPRVMRKVKKEFHALIAALHALPPTRSYILSSKARAEFDRWRESWREEAELAESDAQRGLAGHLGKFQKMALRMALIIHLCRHVYKKPTDPQKPHSGIPKEVRRKSMVEACRILEAMKTHLTRIYRSDDQQDNGTLTKLRQYLLAMSHRQPEAFIHRANVAGKETKLLIIPLYKLTRQMMAIRKVHTRDRIELIETLKSMNWIQPAKYGVLGQVTQIAVNPAVLKKWPEEAKRASDARRAAASVANANFAERRKELRKKD